MELRGFYELKRLVIGNFCFRYANNAVIEDMPELETLVLGDDCLNFSVLLQLISNTKTREMTSRSTLLETMDCSWKMSK